MNRRHFFGALALAPLALLAEALILQHLEGQAPCPLCVLQRAGFLIFALIALAAFVHDSQRRAWMYASALAVVAGAGLSVALRHVWVLYHPKFGCGIDVLEQFVNGLPTARLLPWLLHASGECTAKQEPIFGLQLPEWAAIWFGSLLVASVWAAYRLKKAGSPDQAA